VLIIAFSDAGGILTGNEIGAGRPDLAFRYARRSLIHATLLGLLTGSIILAISGVYPTLYQVTPEVRAQASSILVIMGFLFWLRGSNFTLVVGILRAGGDTRFSALIDTGAVWLVGIPMALAGVYLFHLPVWGVYLLVMADEITRYVITFRRFLSRRWIHHLAGIGAET
jgi:Na+-driven multidrug efflux pump